jgi:hypothetical protein
VDLRKYCKEQDIEASAIKLELTARNIYVVTVYTAPCGNFLSVFQIPSVIVLFVILAFKV